MQHFRAADGRMLSFRDSGGQGPVVLCLAGLTRNARDFDSLAERLAPHRRVVRMNARGRGGSDWAKDPLAEYTIAVELGDVMALIAHLGVTRLAVIGTSRGGILGMALAAAMPGVLSGLVLNDVGAQIETKGLLAIMDYLGHPPDAPDFDAAAAALAERNAAQFPGVPLARWVRHARAIYDDRDGRPVLAYDPALRQAVGATLDPSLPHVDLWLMLDALATMPVLLIRGANSDILSAETAERMQARLPLLTRSEIADRGHAPFLDEPSAIKAIEGFLEGIR
ncbi:MAG: alpha/beta hydrolase [Pseudomonadota bacterium]